MPHLHNIQIYYEDTDLSGVVYHANYLKYFERAREHLIGPEELVRMYREDGVAFVVYKAELTFKEGAVHGDNLEIRTEVKPESKYRIAFHQSVWKKGAKHPMVIATVQLVCVDRENQLVALPDSVHAVLGPWAE